MIWRRTKLDTLGDIQVFPRAVSMHGKVNPKIKIQTLPKALRTQALTTLTSNFG